MIVVTAPTGQIGQQVVRNLLKHDASVRVIARDPSKLPSRIRSKVDIIEGSHATPEIVKRAFDGAETVFWLVPADEKADSVMAAYVDFSRPAAAALKATRVKRVVSVTALGRNTPVAADAGYVTGSLAMDDLIASTGVWTSGRSPCRPSWTISSCRPPRSKARACSSRRFRAI